MSIWTTFFVNGLVGPYTTCPSILTTSAGVRLPGRCITSPRLGPHWSLAPYHGAPEPEQGAHFGERIIFYYGAGGLGVVTMRSLSSVPSRIPVEQVEECILRG